MKKIDEKALYNTRKKIAEVVKKEGNKIVFGYRDKQPEPDRKEGDVWEDIHGKRWTIKNGIKQTVTKLDDAKTPWWCPKCNKPLNHRFDMKFWRIRGHCMDCNIKEEMKIRSEGKWETYERNIMLRNYIAEVKDKINELQSYYDSFSQPEYLLMDEHEKRIMMVERWNVDEKKIKEDLTRDIELLKKNLAETIEQYGTGEDDET